VLNTVAMAGSWIGRFYCDQGWTSQFLTNIQNLDGFGLLSVWRHRACYGAIALRAQKSTFWNRAKVGLCQATI
jgi:hypothetical protein